MGGPLRVVHYLNQFFAGIGAEEKANVELEVRDGPLGPGRLLQQALGDQGTVVSTIICGDNYFIDERDKAVAAVKELLADIHPDVVVAGPAFEAGRYGLNCGEVCRIAREMGIPAVAGMHQDNPGAVSFHRDTLIASTSANPADMRPAIDTMSLLAVRLGNSDELGPALEDGYIPTGLRKLTVAEEPGYKRAIDMLVGKLKGQPFTTEIPVQIPEMVKPAEGIRDLKSATIALISTGGLVPSGNPDRQKAGNPDRYFSYSVKGLDRLTSEDWEAHHQGYYNPTASDNPNYILPLSFVRTFENAGEVGGVHPIIYTMPGVGTPVGSAKHFGVEIAKDLSDAGVDGAILVAT